MKEVKDSCNFCSTEVFDSRGEEVLIVKCIFVFVYLQVERVKVPRRI